MQVHPGVPLASYLPGLISELKKQQSLRDIAIGHCSEWGVQEE